MRPDFGISGKKFFITGGAGFIGTSLSKIISRNNEVMIFDNLYKNAFLNTTLNKEPNIRLVTGNVLDLNALEKIIDPDTDYLIHCAAIAGVDTVLEDPVLTLEVNIKGVFNVFKAASKLKNLKRIIDFSTSEIYGKYALNAVENDPCPPVSIDDMRWSYALSKLSGEVIARAYNIHKNMPTVTIRPFNIFGPNQVGIGAVHNFVVRALKGLPLKIHNDGKQIRSWCYIDDLVKGVLLALEKDIAVGRVYNIGNPDNTISVYNLAEMIRTISGSRSKIKFKKIDYADVELRIPKIDLACRDLSFKPEINMRTGLGRTIDWYEEILRISN